MYLAMLCSQLGEYSSIFPTQLFKYYTNIKRHILNTFERLSVLFIDCLGRSGLQHSLLLQATVGYAECEMGARVECR